MSAIKQRKWENIMKSVRPLRLALATACAVASIALDAPSQAAPTLSAQGYLSTAGSPAPDGNYGLLFRLYDAEAAAGELWKELHPSAKISGGRFTVSLGSVAPIPLELFAKPYLWLGVQVVPEEGETARVLLGAVPYAFHTASATTATQAALAKDLQCVGCVSTAHVGFSFAGSTSKGGPASDLDCVGCVDPADLAQGAVTSDKLAAAAVGTAALGTGVVTGDALAAGAVTSDKLAAGAVGAAALGVNWALAADKGGAALVAKDLQCSGCVSADELEAGLVSKLLPIATASSLGGVMVGAHLDVDAQGTISVKGADFLASTGGALTGGLSVGGPLSVAGDASLGGHTVKAFRVENAGSAPACDANKAGALYFDTAKKVFYGCTGAEWKALHK